MKYLKFGRTGLDVSRLCLGCMSYGVPERGAHSWSLGEAQSRPFIRRALDLGINFFDTANVYSEGTSEEIVGRALSEYARREEVVIATKVNGRMRKGPNGAGLSRKAIMTEIDASLRRLGTDYVDLYQIHRWDYGTPIEETLEALHDVVKAGKARYIGASSMHAWQFAKALHVSQQHGWTRFVSMQNYLNLLYREEEREMLPLCRDQGIAVIPWSPMARGRLTRDWDAKSARTETDDYGRTLYLASTADADRQVVEAVAAVAAARGVPRAQVALAWVLNKNGVTAPIVGATKLEQLDDAVAALSLELSAEEIATLERPYQPHPVVGHA
jgi:aryl-alcohol dehydrogenase-like predicted oxidoreductase